ncbi:hypothetical protein [Actinoplanes utahensis]|uniref:hypothetical protein n=1 Tax=Actinoplanes utahensis TaxID=1869 RepID=UPI000B2F40A3|nr:hypothetical protein [Actinoplanes utahensis]GIF30048.1 hypothetical protein Aut01nite_30340 [Actinoplanes utahensis]
MSPRNQAPHTETSPDQAHDPSHDQAPGNRDTEVIPRAEAPSDLNQALAAAGPRRWWNRTTIGLLGVVLLVGGFLGGVQAHERWGVPASSGTSGMAGGFGGGGRGGASVAPGDAGTAGQGTTGTVKLVDGTTLYVQTASGETVTVRTSDRTAVKVSQTASLASLTSGLAVTVQGVPDSEGIISATAVTAG